jgi:hypothetical protein
VELQLRHSSSILHSTESLNHCCTDGALPLAVLQQCRGSGSLLLRESDGRVSETDQIEPTGNNDFDSDSRRRSVLLRGDSEVSVL